MSQLSSFETAALPHRDAAYTLAFWLVRNRADAEDVVQEAYLRAFRAYASLSGPDIKPWLLTIVRNVAYRLLGKRGAASNVISFEEAFPGRFGEPDGVPNLVSETASPEAALIGEAERVMVVTALSRLPPAWREVLVLREIEGLAYREIADVIGVPVGTVMSRLSRARAELRAVLTGLMDKDESNAV